MYLKLLVNYEMTDIVCVTGTKDLSFLLFLCSKLQLNIDLTVAMKCAREFLCCCLSVCLCELSICGYIGRDKLSRQQI